MFNGMIGAEALRALASMLYMSKVPNGLHKCPGLSGSVSLLLGLMQRRRRTEMNRRSVMLHLLLFAVSPSQVMRKPPTGRAPPTELLVATPAAMIACCGTPGIDSHAFTRTIVVAIPNSSVSTATHELGFACSFFLPLPRRLLRRTATAGEAACVERAGISTTGAISTSRAARTMRSTARICRVATFDCG